MAYRPYQGIAQPKPQKPSYAEWWEPVAANALSLPLALTERLVGAGIDQTVAPGGAVWDAFSTQGQVDKYNQEVVDAARAREMAIAEKQIGLDFLPREKESSLGTAEVSRQATLEDVKTRQKDSETKLRGEKRKEEAAKWTREGPALPPGQTRQGPDGESMGTQYPPRARGGGGGSANGNDMYVVSKDGQVYPAAMYEEVAKNTRDELAKLESVAEGHSAMGLPPNPELLRRIEIARGRVDDLRYAAKVKDPTDASRIAVGRNTQGALNNRSAATIDSRETLTREEFDHEARALDSKIQLAIQKANAEGRQKEAESLRGVANSLAGALAKASSGLGTPRSVLNSLESAYQNAAGQANKVPARKDIPDKQAARTEALQLLKKHEGKPKTQEKVRARYEETYGEKLE